MELSMGQRQAVTKKLALAYKESSRSQKSWILDQLVELTAWHRGYTRSALGAALVVKPRATRTPKFDAHLIASMATCWALMRAPAGKRLAPMLATVVPLLRRDCAATAN
jgi:hypothetical protein